MRPPDVNRALDSTLRFLSMTGVVATMLCIPVGAVLAALAFVLFGLPLHSFLTFGERVLAPVGLVAWWALAWLPAAVYAAVFWHD